MLEWLNADVNTFKLYFFAFTSLISLAVFIYYRFYIVKKKILFLFLTFFLFLFHSIFFSYDVLFSVGRSLYVLSVLFTLYCFVRIITPEVVLKYYVRFVVFIAALILISSDADLLLGAGPSAYIDSHFRGVAANSNTLALYLSVFIAPVILSIYYRDNRRIVSFVTLFVIANLSVILFLTKSRAGIAVFLISFLYAYLAYNTNTTEKYKHFFYVIIFCGIGAVLFSGEINQIVFKGNEGNIIGSREILWLTRLEAISERPFFGWGFQVNEFERINKFLIFNSLEKGNILLAVLEEFGLIFGTLIVGAFGYIFYQVYIIAKETKYHLFLSLTLIGTLLHSQLETWVFNFNGFITLFFWLLVITVLELSESRSKLGNKPS
jgi:hypothetical protein